MSETIRFLDDYRSLNETACKLIDRANDGEEVLLSTVRARWLSTGLDDPPLSSRHRPLFQRLERIGKRSVPGAPRCNAKILLLEDPTHEANPWQVSVLLRAGADVRYVSSKERLRWIITGQELLVAVSTRAEDDSIVNCGVYYASDVPNNAFINYWRHRLLATFDLGRRLVLDQNGVIRRERISPYRVVKMAVRSMNAKDVLLILLGLSLGIVASLIAAAILGASGG